MTSRAKALSDFMDAWSTGRRPDVVEHLARVEVDERELLADELLLWLAIAPTPAPAREAPVLDRLRDAAGSAAGLLTGLDLEPLAAEVTEALGLPPEATTRVAEGLGGLRRGELDALALSRRLLDALASARGTSAVSVTAAASFTAPAFAAFRAVPDHPRWVTQDLDVLTRAAMSPAPGPMDPVDALLRGGREA